MRRTTLFLLLATLPSGCEESTGPDRATPADLDVVIPAFTDGTVSDTVSIAGDRPASGDDADWSEAAILSTSIEAGFRPDYAFSQAGMEFWANRATIGLAMTLMYGNSPIGTANGSAAFAQWIPWRDRIHTSTALGITGNCGHIVNANAAFDAWHQFDPNGPRILGESVTRPAVAHQPTCDPEPVKVTKEIVKAGGNNEDDADWYICYYTYYYDSYSGKLLRTEFHGCEPL